ncbi:type II secretion system protein GspD [Halocola ammonii]
MVSALTKSLHLLFLFVLCSIFSIDCFSQEDGTERIQQIRNELETLTVDQPGLDESIQTSVSGVSITEFIRTIGINHELNINVSDSLNQRLINNFANARVADVLVFLCKEYSLDIEIIGGIISVKKWNRPSPPVIPTPPRVIDIEYFPETDFISLDLKRDSLGKVARKITKESVHNVVLSPNIENKLVSVYIQNRPFADALEKMAYANGLEIEKDGNFFLVSELTPEEPVNNSRTASNSRNSRGQRPQDEEGESGEINVSLAQDSLRVSVRANDAEILDIIEEVSDKLLKNFFVITPPEGRITTFIDNATYEEVLTYLFHGTEYSFTIDERVYLIGNSQEDGIETTEMIQLKYRTIENVFDSFGGGSSRSSQRRGTGQNQGPGGAAGSSGGQSVAVSSPFMSPDLKIQSFPELNSFIVSGSYPDVKQFKDFIHQVDQVVPVVMIEILIVDVNKNRTVATGINAGLSEEGAADQTNGQITSDQGLNLDVSTETINGLLGNFNTAGIVNLGNVSPDFYLRIQALESDGVIRTRSIPKLSTLNSYTASLSIGRQEYYLETRTNVNPSAGNNVITEQQVWQPLNADLSINVTPVVSGAEQVTLSINVTQSDFTERSGANGPFGSVNREFESSIRVKNGEMILLGGLEDKSNNSSGGGIPLISRIPVLKWLFGSRSKSKSQSRLNIFIRPTIMY